MKHIFLFLIAAILLSSCSITERRYMPGYYTSWGHKSPKTIAHCEPAISRNVAATKIEPIPTKELTTIAAPIEKWPVSVKLKPVYQFHKTHTPPVYVASNSKLVSPIVLNAPKVQKGQPQFYTGDEQEDDHARKSLTYGILSLCGPAAGFLIMLGIVLSVGGTLAKPVTYAAAIFAAGCTGGLVFAVFAIINGFIAINEINAAPDTYNGKGDAVLGILLAGLVPIGLAAYLLLRFH